MKEIEIKAHLKDRKGVIEKLISLGCIFGPEVVQDDTVYAEKIGSLSIFLSNDVFLRIRVRSDKKILFTLKKPGVNVLDALEHEVEISSKNEMEDALLLMGYSKAIRIKKSRMVTHYEGCEICIDEVEGLGSFIEMEKLTKEGDSEKIQESLFEFFQSIGIKKEDRVRVGYDVLMLEKK